MGYIGFQLGLSSELVKGVSLCGGFFVSFRYYQGLGDYLANRTFLPIEWAAAFALVGLVGGIYFLLTRVFRLLEKLIQVTFQTKVNQWGGLLAGIGRGALVASVILVVLRQLPSGYLTASIEEHSVTGSTLSRLAPAVYDSVTPLFTRFFSTLRTPSA